MITTKNTYRKLEKVMCHVPYSVARDFLDNNITCSFLPLGGLRILTRGNNRIAYFRPDNGRAVNDKIWMIHWNHDDTVDVYI